jgi:hypothetical protein
MKSVFFSGVLMMMTFLGDGDKILGRWETKPSVYGNVTGVFFKPDNTYEAYINKKPFVSGKYVLEDSVISITENGCKGITGSYKIILYSNSDSLRFQSLVDSCNERREGMNRIVLGRVK